ncbi:MAG: bifunctional phosphoribosylaminoimidazolecarboxamide formyltransferase/IMP cyclohydrolase [Euryarchaeota archaeon]|nr:bifunctional phosphoribosylaminoimidazolecarboxamide formyltransferase/IMP cyclohydrolase [Euryarchaeota archaeon]
MRALISVSNKEKLDYFASALQEMRWDIISTGGTYKFLKEHGISAKKVEDITGFPEILNGRVKTLHPVIHGGILAENVEDLNGTGIEAIDMVVVNLYPFEKFKDAGEAEMVENIDIGGVALLRAAAKNYHRVIVVSSPAQYEEVLNALKTGTLNEEMRKKYAMRAFALTASYDALIYNALWRRFGEGLPEHLLIARPMRQRLRYGENPHQRGAFYSLHDAYVQHHGKELSFNNLYDLDSAYALVREFDEPAAVVVKHANPCGAAIGATLADAFERAWAGDPMSAYGSIVAFNNVLDGNTALLLKKKFIEVVVAPGFTEDALRVLKKKKNLRIVEMKDSAEEIELRMLRFGVLAQDWNTKELEGYRVVSKRKPTDAELNDLLFAWKVVKYVKSNAIVFVKDRMLVGAGAGQMSRVDAVKIAAMKAGARAKGAVMASDAFFPFRDGVDTAYEAGVSAVIQPGGSIRDDEVIAAVDEHNMAMLFTGFRVFRH